MAPSKKKGESGKSIMKRPPPPPPPPRTREDSEDERSEDGQEPNRGRMIGGQGSARIPEDLSILHVSNGVQEINDDDWREEMRNELRAELRSELRGEMRSAVRKVMGESSSVVKRPREVDTDEVLESNAAVEALKKVEASNRSNKFAIRLASITKEGNKAQFSEMVDLREYLEKADGILQDPKRLGWDDIFAARDAIGEATKLVDSRMGMIERIDKHPLSWPVATEFQKLKRAKSSNIEDEKLFLQAEKNVSEERKKREDTQKAGAKAGPDRFHYTKRQGTGLPQFLLCSAQG